MRPPKEKAKSIDQPVEAAASASLSAPDIKFRVPKFHDSAPVVPAMRSEEKAKGIDQVVEAAATAGQPSPVIAHFLDIITSETGCELDELADKTTFSSLGCDSLTALSVAGRMREEMEIDIGSHALLEYPTIGQFKAIITQLDPQESRKGSEASRLSSYFDEDELSPLSPASSCTTPIGSDDGSGQYIKCDAATPRDVVRSTIAEEMGIGFEECLAAPDLASLGMDSLMALTISGILREKTGLDVPKECAATEI